MSTPVLATKLYPPAHRPHLVARPRLTGRLDSTLEPGNRLTLVCAPAGFGKTTVLSDWLSRLARWDPPVRVAWLSLDDGDNDLPRLLSHLVAGLRGAGLAVDPEALAAVTASSGALVSLLNDVTHLGAAAPDQHWVLVLDDYHLIEAAEVHDAVAFLAEHLPGHLHPVVATRSDPPLPLARMRARGQLTELRAADLRFTAAEAYEFLTGTMALDLSAAEVEALDERTEGWVAGLQLAALSLRGLDGGGEVAGFIEAFTGSNRFVVDYLVDEVLARQPVEVRDFLLDSAVLDQLSAPLCDAVTGREDSALLLRRLERDNLFLVPLDAERVWYRYHHLFADVLRARLLADHPDRMHRLHRQASDWHASRGLLPDAVRHALAAEDFSRAVRLMEEGVPELRRTRQDGLLMSWVGSVPDALVCRSPVLSILAAWSRLMSGDLDGVETWLDRAEAALVAADDDDPALAATWPDTEDLRTAPGMIAMYRASLAQARGDVDGTAHHARRALELVGPQDHFVRGAGSAFLGLATWAAGDVPRALSTFADAVRSLHAAGNLVDELDSTVVLADMWLALGRPGRARGLFEEGLRTSTRAGAPYVRATSDFHVGLAELDRELDELESAKARLETARVLGERASITENRHRWFVVSALVATAEGDTATALRLLDEAESLYRRGFYPETRPIPAIRARLLVAGGKLDAAARWAEERGLSAEDDPGYLREYEHLTLVRLLLAQRRVTAALGLLDRLHEAAAGAGREGSRQEVGVLQALGHHLAGDLPRAVEALGRAWAQAPEPDAYLRLYLDEGEPMAALLRDVARAPRHTVVATVGDEHADAVLDRARRLALRAGPTDPGRPAWPTADPLSRRELEVLRLLDSELTGPEIARQLYVSLNTLRTHTKRIFTKLDVRTRGAAVRRAREEGLL